MPLAPGLLRYLKSDKPLVLYGAASSGVRTLNNLSSAFIEAERISFFDSDPEKHGKTLEGRPILTEAEFRALDRDTLIIISSALHYEIAPALTAAGFSNAHYVHELVYSAKPVEKFAPEFLRIVDVIKNISFMPYDELHTLYSSMQAVTDVPGAVAEVGTYKGGSAYLLARCAGGKRLYLFDTFAGLPRVQITEHTDAASKLTHPLNEPAAGWLSDTDDESVRRFVLDSGIRPGQLELRKGIFPSSAAGLEQENFSFVHLDTDLYQSTFDALEFFYPRLTPGGRIVSHDYNTQGCAGVKKAFDDFLYTKELYPWLVEISETQAMLIKHG